ncbi:MAG: hypothetical protein GX351_06540 [Peptococcaceae bacterium]|nr:hypothetical protein [Peptococcaceae bacterium]
MRKIVALLFVISIFFIYQGELIYADIKTTTTELNVLAAMSTEESHKAAEEREITEGTMTEGTVTGESIEKDEKWNTDLWPAIIFAGVCVVAGSAVFIKKGKVKKKL